MKIPQDAHEFQKFETVQHRDNSYSSAGDLEKEEEKRLVREQVRREAQIKAKEARNGDLCNGEEGVMNIFVYNEQGYIDLEEDSEIMTGVLLEKITDIESYRMTPSSLIPPGDCIIIEFGPEKNKTDKICKTYEGEELIFGS